MLKTIFLLTSSILFWLHTDAQEIIANSGQFGNGSEGSLSWTLGEPITESTSGPTNILTQGLQQDFERFVGNSETYQDDQILIYPNPFTNEITLSSGQAFPEYHVVIMDAQLKRVSEMKLTLPNGVSSYQIDLSTLSGGLYFLTIVVGDSVRPITEQIIKIDENH